MEDTPEDLNQFEVQPVYPVEKTEQVNHPKHYQGKGIEAIDVIECFELGFNLGNVVKYILRAGKKSSAKIDLEKAKWYLERELQRVNIE